MLPFNHQILSLRNNRILESLWQKRRYCGKPFYTQGQSYDKNIREYFYYIDHQGMRIRPNETKRYEKDFPFISLCGRERNYIRCDDVPLVYSHVIIQNGHDMFCYGNAGDLLCNRFEPNKIFMNPNSGRVYHPCDARFGSIGLVKSKLAIEFSKLFSFEQGETNPPTRFKWKGILYDLDNEWLNFKNVQNIT